MARLQDMMCIEYIIPVSIIIVICLPLLPNKRLRFYTCYASYASVVSVVSLAILPIAIWRPKDVVSLKIAANIIKYSTKILGIHWELRNGKVLKEDRGFVIIANHQDSLDIMGMFNIWDIMDKCTAVAKKELIYFPPFGPIAWLAGLIFIDRINPKAANTSLKVAAAHYLHKKKAKIWLFPEGTRNQEVKGILPFKNGAFRVAIESQVPIIPIVISPYYFIDLENKTFSKGKIIMSVLDAISTEGLTISDLNMLKEKTHSLMSSEFEKLKKEVTLSHKINKKIH